MGNDLLALWIRMALCACALLFCAIFLTAPALAQEFSDEAYRQAVSDLGSNDFATREDAQRRLIAMGAPALQRLRTLPPDADLERRRRTGEIIAELNRQIPVGEFNEAGLQELAERVRTQHYDDYYAVTNPEDFVDLIIRAFPNTHIAYTGIELQTDALGNVTGATLTYSPWRGTRTYEIFVALRRVNGRLIPQGQPRLTIGDINKTPDVPALHLVLLSALGSLQILYSRKSRQGFRQFLYLAQ